MEAMKLLLSIVEPEGLNDYMDFDWPAVPRAGDFILVPKYDDVGESEYRVERVHWMPLTIGDLDPIIRLVSRKISP